MGTEMEYSEFVGKAGINLLLNGHNQSAAKPRRGNIQITSEKFSIWGGGFFLGGEGGCYRLVKNVNCQNFD